MAQRLQILQTAQDQFPQSANKTIMVANAWCAADSTLDRPAANGTDGWTVVGKPATYDVVVQLRDQGFSYLSLEASGPANRRKDVRVADLI